MPATSAERVRAYRQRQREQGAADTSRSNRKRHKADYRTESIRQKPFVGCDGEGAGTDAQGRQLYSLFRMGDRELIHGELR
jgi:hypothetical protein